MVSSRLAGIPLPIVSEDAEWLEQLTLRASRRRADDRRTGGRLHLGMVAGFKSERWPTSNRNPGRLRVGIGGRIKSESAIRLPDILVVSPYNAQVNLLTEKLPEGARVGTVDRFQGQEAPVCLISMATSSGDDLPRDIEFLFSLNRLNVAISRAQALTILIASPRLMDVPSSALAEMRLVNALCALCDYAKSFSSTENKNCLWIKLIEDFDEDYQEQAGWGHP